VHVSPRTAVRTCLRKYADFDGRAVAAEYWWFLLLFVVVAVLTRVLDAVLHTWWGSFGLFSTAAVLGLGLPLLAAGSRRLHDTGRTGLWQLVAMVPCGGFLLLFNLADPSQGDNQYGPRIQPHRPRPVPDDV
jgi:uncharacterized membrane protein YhaH (DUF805 family)